MQIFITGQALHTLDVSHEDTVMDVKTRIAQLEGLLDCDLVLSCAGISLGDEASLSDCGVQDRRTLNLAGRLLGGKFYRTLNRAGKVRGQTPKQGLSGMECLKSRSLILKTIFGDFIYKK